MYAVTETKSFIEGKNWIFVFGEILILQEPDKIAVAKGKQMNFDISYAYLMLFKDGNRIDIGLKTKEAMLGEYLSDTLTVPLLDKDNCLPEIPPVSDANYWIKKPTEAIYASCRNEFRRCLQNVAKGIARDELPYAMRMFNSPVRNMLHLMIEWHITCDLFRILAISVAKDLGFTYNHEEDKNMSEYLRCIRLGGRQTGE